MSHTEKSKDVAEYLALRANQDQPITVEEFRRLFLKGLAALVREADSISYTLKKYDNQNGGGYGQRH